MARALEILPAVLQVTSGQVRLTRMSGEPAALGVGSLVAGRYALRSVISRGVAAVVYEAGDLRLGHAVALKTLLFREPVAMRRFEREARVSSSLHHPNVCLVTDFGYLEDGAPYLVMERLFGVSLAQRLASSGPLAIAEAVDIAQQVLSVLAVAQERAIVHRDIKPSNLLLAHVPGRPALVKVLDFGVATGDSEEGLTAEGTVLGTPAYMSPEQAAGESDIDSRSDIYACGVVLYECLTGTRPFTGQGSRALIMEILRGGAPPVVSLRRDVPADIARAVDRAMARDRAERFPTATAFLAALGGTASVARDEWDYSTQPLETPPNEQFDDRTHPMSWPRGRDH